tara:strand:+ start:3569 stop:4108 length:540 start_codon:yes stop_codon:yes gene_type:complete
MKLYADRLAKLAGLSVANSGVLSEASNRSYNDDPALDNESNVQHGKGQLAEMNYDEAEEEDIDDILPEGDEDDDAVDKQTEAADNTDDDSIDEDDETGDDLDDGVVLEIDEKMLAQEIKRMRAERLQETDLRQVVRNEIRSIVNSLQERDPALGGYKRFDKDPRKGSVTQGFAGIGFKK